MNFMSFPNIFSMFLRKIFLVEDVISSPFVYKSFSDNLQRRFERLLVHNVCIPLLLGSVFVSDFSGGYTLHNMKDDILLKQQSYPWL